MKPSKPASKGFEHKWTGLKARCATVRRDLAGASQAWRLTTVAALLMAGLSGCSSLDPKTEVSEAVRTTRNGPASAPERTLTNFSDAMRCMDNLFITYGIRDVAVLVEDIDDKTKKVTAGTKDMLISATSSMTRRSRAIRLVTFGKDSSSLAEWIIRSQRSPSPFNDLPQFAIRGSVSQFDQSLVSSEGEMGVSLGGKLSGGVAKRASASRMAIDLNMIHGSNFAIVPGVTSQNSILLYNEGQGLDAEATIRKFGINFNMTIARSEGQAQGLRNLVDLAAIELYGRLSRTPYWSCIGYDTAAGEVGKEIEDWFYAMERGGELIPYVQYQMRNRGYYGGPIDGQPSAALGESVALYRAAMGGERGRGKIDSDFFKRYLATDHAQVMAQHPPPSPVPGAVAEAARPVLSPAPAAVAAATSAGVVTPAAGRLQLSLQSANGEQMFERGRAVQLAVFANRQAHLHCYMRDERQQIQRIFPNRFNRDTLIRPGETLHLPGQMRFQILTSQQGTVEAVICYATERDVLAQLPRHISGADFERLQVASLDEIKAAFRTATHDQFAEGVFHVRTR
jgi:Domain of unknown function (DUF4384)